MNRAIFERGASTSKIVTDYLFFICEQFLIFNFHSCQRVKDKIFFTVNGNERHAKMTEIPLDTDCHFQRYLYNARVY